MANMLGKKYHGYTSSFEDPKYVKKALNDWINKAEKRLIELTNYDERLRLTTSMELNHLRKNFKKIPQEDKEWEIITNLLDLINHLLGYDWMSGEVNRHIIYFQDRTQEMKDESNRGKVKRDDIEWLSSNIRLKQKKIINQLKKDGLSDYKISFVMNLSISTIKRISKGE